MPVATHEHTKQKEHEAAHEQWVQAELGKDPTLTVLRILYNDLRHLGNVLPETWDYFDLHEHTGGAENMGTQHITYLTGDYDPETDEIVAAVAGGERITYDGITVNGLERAKKRQAANADFGFQVVRDQIYHNNYHGPVKEMWRGNASYDTVIYESAFPQEVIDQHGDYGRQLLQELNYDAKDLKGFLNIFRKNPHTGKPEYAAIRLGNATPEYMGAYLQHYGFDVTGLDSHQFGGQVITLNTGDRTFTDVAEGEVAKFDAILQQATGKRHSFGLDKAGIDAYALFKQCPNLWGAYRQYHKLLAGHFAGAPLATDLYDYLVSTQVAVGFHVLHSHEAARLSAQLDAGKITADMALACKKIMTYAHYATLNQLLETYRATGIITDIDGDDLMQAYGAAAGGNGGAAAERGDVLGDCESTYGIASNAAALAAREGISLEEALRRLNRKPERWTEGQCRNCERETYIWKEPDGGCNICKSCADAHTLYKELGLAQERRKARIERQNDLQKHARLYKEATPEVTAAVAEDEIAVGATRVVNGQRQVYMRWISTGSATNVWVNAATGKPVPDSGENS